MITRICGFFLGVGVFQEEYAVGVSLPGQGIESSRVTCRSMEKEQGYQVTGS